MSNLGVRYSYLPEQFAECDELWERLRAFVATGDFTLGRELEDFERQFAELIGVRYAIGVNSGTDALKLLLKHLGVGLGDEVITSANTFVATVGAIAELGAKPVFVDCDETFCIRVDQVAGALTERTRAIVPVHYSGYMADMKSLMSISESFKIPVVEDACQAILAERDGISAGTSGSGGAFSLHPLKNLNVWSDGGIITTNSDDVNEHVRLLRNHGLLDRDTVKLLGFNSRLDTFQAVVGAWLLPKARDIARSRANNAVIYDEYLSGIPEIRIPERRINETRVYHLYIVYAQRRDELLRFLNNRGIEAKVHYPTPIYLQPALRFLGHKPGDFPITDDIADHSITFPCDQHLTRSQIEVVVDNVRAFYSY